MGMTASIISLIWIANSLVGEIIKAFGESNSTSSFFYSFFTNISKIGNPKHNVFP